MDIFCLSLVLGWCELREIQKYMRICKGIAGKMNYEEIWKTLRIRQMSDITCCREDLKKFIKVIQK
jgi:hypothetical protein